MSKKEKIRRPVDLGVSAYATADAMFLTNGPKYFELISSTKDLADQMTALAKGLVEAEPQYVRQQTESSLFPPEFLDASSISLHMSDVFGFSGLNNVYTAGYSRRLRESPHLYPSVQSPEEAANLAAAYSRFLLENGGSEAGEVADAPDSKVYKVFDTYEVVMHRGKFFAGAHESDDMESATISHRGFTANWDVAGQ